MGWRGLSPRITLTAGEVRIDAGFLRRRETTLPRSDIRSAVIYDGDGTVVLLGGEGELLRIHHVGEATTFAETLGVPTVAWPIRVGVDPAWWTFYLALWLGVAAVPMFFIAM